MGRQDTAFGKVVQNSGTVNVSDEMQMAGLVEGHTGTTARYEIHGGTLTVGTFLQIGRLGTGDFVQDGTSTVNMNRNDETRPDHGRRRDGSGTYTLDAGTLNVPNGYLTLGSSGTGTLTISGAAQANFLKGASLGTSGTGNGRLVQNGGVVTVGNGTGSPSAGTFGLLVSANTGGGPTQGTYELNAGELPGQSDHDAGRHGDVRGRRHRAPLTART